MIFTRIPGNPILNRDRLLRNRLGGENFTPTSFFPFFGTLVAGPPANALLAVAKIVFGLIILAGGSVKATSGGVSWEAANIDFLHSRAGCSFCGRSSITVSVSR